MLARLVVVPVPAQQARLHAADVRRDQVQEAARHEEAPRRRERRDRVREVLDRVVERDDVEARRGKVQLLEAARGDAQPSGARALRGERGDLDALDVPARGLRLEEEVAERTADVEEPALAPVAPLDRLDPLAKRPLVHVGVEEVVRVAALWVVGRVVGAAVERGRRERARVLPYEATAAAGDDERAVHAEERARLGVGAERAALGDLRARKGPLGLVDEGGAEARDRAH